MRTHRERIDVAWAHCDAAGIVFYPNFYTWFDQATEKLFRANGLGYAAIESAYGVIGMPLVETGARYVSPCRLGDALEIESRVEEWAGRSFVVRHSIAHLGGTQAVDGFERRVMVRPDPDSPKGIRAIDIPDDVIERFVD